MVISEIKLGDVKKALRIDYSFDDDRIEVVIMPAALHRVMRLTGLTEEALDNYPELVHAYMCICNDMYDDTNEREKAYTAICHSVQSHMLM